MCATSLSTLTRANSTADRPLRTPPNGMNSRSDHLPFVRSGPGQDLEALVDRFTERNLEIVLGTQVIALVRRLSKVQDSLSALRRVAVFSLRGNAHELLQRLDVRIVCLDAMNQKKQHELTRRLGFQDLTPLRHSQFTTNHDTDVWRSFLGFFGIDTSDATTSPVIPHSQDVVPSFGLFPHQRRTVRSILDIIRHGRTRVVLHMPTGSGKTRTAMHAICHYLAMYEPCPIVWCANSAELLEQAADAFVDAWSHLGDRQVNLLRFWGRHDADISTFSDGLLVASLQKLHARKKADPISVLRLARPVRLVVVDEAHQAIAPTYRKLLTLLADTGEQSSMLGLTATPGRTYSDIEADARLADFFGGKKITFDAQGHDTPISFLVQNGYLARPKFRQIEFEGSSNGCTTLPSHPSAPDYAPDVLDSLAQQVDRNNQIVNEVQRLIDAGHTRIILFAASVAHAHVLAAGCHAIGVPASAITADTPAGTRHRIISKFRHRTKSTMVLCNYGVLTTGFDAPNTSAAVIARPTKSLVLFSQMLGRATRGPKAGGNPTCEIVTVVDLDLPGFRSLAEAFTNWDDVWQV